MVERKAMIVLALAASVALSACMREPGGMMNLRASAAGPDEFAILPTRPLTMPSDYAALPEPTPGGSNRTDPTPIADATKALGGNPKRLAETGRIPAGDGAMVTAASRYGVNADIRGALAEEEVTDDDRDGEPEEEEAP